tara:strand:- start:510 stop:1181 length:672 start_codon:yes stop_codon:yes gene_type:complete
MDNKKNEENIEEIFDFSDLDEDEDNSNGIDGSSEIKNNIHEDNDKLSCISYHEGGINIPDNDIEIELNDNVCNICYMEKEYINNLECCKNTKKICNECLDCLKSPICPYCRQNLPSSLNRVVHPSSCPSDFSFNRWMTNESRYMVIDPYSPEYQDSRVLRRDMRRLRRNYYRNRDSGGLYTKQERVAYRRYKRRQLRNQTREILNRVNQNRESIDDLSFDDIF